MQNAHQRLGCLHYKRNTEKTNTQISVHVDHYIGNGERPSSQCLWKAMPR
jgi:hypothetical protein